MAFLITGRGCFGEFGQDVLSFMEFIKQVVEIRDEQLIFDRREIRENSSVDITDIMGNVKYSRISELAKYAVKTSNEALIEAGLIGSENSNRIGIFMGTKEGTEIALHKFYKLLKDNNYKKGNPLLFPETALNVPASYISIAHKITGPIISNASGFTAGLEVLEIAMNYLNYGAIDYAVIVCAEEADEFLSWKAHKKSLMQSNSHEIISLGKQRGTMVGRASCLVIKREDGEEGKGSIRSISFTNECSDDAVTLTIDEVLNRAEITPRDVDLVIRQDSGNAKLAAVEENCLRRIVPDGLPFVSLERLLGKQAGDSTLLVIIWATLIRQYPGIFEEYLKKDPKMKSILGSKGSLRTILITSLSPTGKYGALLIKI